MKPQPAILIIISVFLILVMAPRTTVEAQKNTKAGVVRIENTKHNEVGAGFIVKITDKKAYVVTAAHVVRGEHNPRVFLFGGRDQALSATVIDREEDDVKGLALLTFTETPQTLSRLVELKLATTSDLGDGESVTFIGFPGTPFWTVDIGNIRRLEGKNLVLSGTARQGSSGGPVVLNQHAIGLVTDISQSDVYAARAETIEVYVNGLIANLVDIADRKQPKVDEFCQALASLNDAGKDGFYSVIGEPSTINRDLFYSKILLPGTERGYVVPRKQVYFFLLHHANLGKVQQQFYETVGKVKRCLRDWNENEETGTSFVFHKFRDPNGSAVVEIAYENTDSNRKGVMISIYR